MSKFRTKPIVIEATQWFKHGDHPAVGISHCYFASNPSKPIGTLIVDDYFKMVYPGYWVITHTDGTHEPMSRADFEQTYEPVEE